MAIDDGLLYEAPVRVKYYPDGSTFLVWTAPDGATVQVPWEDDPEGARPRSIVEPKADPNWRDIADEMAGAIESTLRDNYEDDSCFDPRELEVALRRYEEAKDG